jgi:hypothetical protein
MEDVGIFYVRLAYFTAILVYYKAIWYIFPILVYFVLFWYVVPRQIWQPCTLCLSSHGSVSYNLAVRSTTNII